MATDLALDHDPNNPNVWKLYWVGGFIVWGRKSAGGGFYDIQVHKTKMKARYLAEIFELNAQEVKEA